MPVLRDLGLPLLAHAELDLGASPFLPTRAPITRYLASRPPEWEDAAIRLLVELCRETRCRVHIVHLSSSGSLADLAPGEGRGPAHHGRDLPALSLLRERSDPARAPPSSSARHPFARSKEPRGAVGGLFDGVIDFVITDHSPCLPALKLPDLGDFDAGLGRHRVASARAPGRLVRGSPSRCEPFYAGALDERAARRIRGLPRGGGPRGAGLRRRFRRLGSGSKLHRHATIAILRHPVSPYLGRELFGAVRETWLRGQRIFSSAGHAPRASGQLLLDRSGRA